MKKTTVIMGNKWENSNTKRLFYVLLPDRCYEIIVKDQGVRMRINE